MIEIQLLKRTKRNDPESRFVLPALVKPYVEENDFIAFLICTDHELHSRALLWLSEVSFELTPLGKTEQGSFAYECFTEFETEEENQFKTVSKQGTTKLEVQFVKVFLNNFGTCEVYIEKGESDDKRVKIGEVEVLSTKIFGKDLNDIFDFLLEQNVSYWEPFSPVKSKEAGENADRYHLFWLLKAVQRDLGTLQEISPRFQIEPRTRLISYKEVVSYSENVDITESSLEWLLENTDVLEPTNQPISESTRIRNRFFNINHIQTEYLQESTDVYENQIIHGYLVDVVSFFSDKSELIQQRVKTLQGEIDASGDKVTLINKQRLRYYERLLHDSSAVVQQSERILSYFHEYLPVSKPLIEFPTRSEGFEVKDHYQSLLGPIRNWFNRDKNLQFGDNQLFTGTRTLDKLYELFCLFKIIEALEALGFRLRETPVSQIKTENELEQIDSERTGLYKFFSHQGVNVNLYYELIPPSHRTVIYTSRGRFLKPDFVIEYKSETSKQVKLLILDAKYQKVSSVRKFTYRDLIPKYLHGIGRPEGGNADIMGLFILHPADSDYTKAVESWFRSPNGLFDQKPIWPTIGRIEIPTAKSRPNELTSVLTCLFEKTL